MKRKLRDINQETQLLALDFLDYSIDDGKMPLWTQVSTKDFLQTFVNLLKSRDSPEVSQKILYLIQKWGGRFEKYYEIIPNFTDMYKQLKNSGIQFPEGNLSTYSKYTMSEEALDEYNSNIQRGGNNYQEKQARPSSSMINMSGHSSGGIKYMNSTHKNFYPNGQIFYKPNVSGSSNRILSGNSLSYSQKNFK
mgnify:CR=1 FL=1